ncbi:MAG TPA: IS5 family transposase [Nitrosomonas sp.]|nr:IS5 family transposase [Nitrosomonas sp.]
MIRFRNHDQLSIEEFDNPLQVKLSKENKWVALANSIPWDKLEKIYFQELSPKMGRPSIDARIVIGALIIKHMKKLSDIDTIESIQENMYQQYFLGLSAYSYKPVFDPSLFVTIRKRLGADAFDRMVLELIAATTNNEAAEKKDNEPPISSSGPSAETPSDEKTKENKGILIVDMTVAPADITYPTDIGLLNTAREKTEAMIDHLFSQMPHESVKPRTYRRIARKAYLSYSKKKRRSQSDTRKARRKQLGFVLRNIGTIYRMLESLPDGLPYAMLREFWIIQELYRQQKEMHDTRSMRVDDRIVSISQPHVRPIVRGKQAASVEFGAQVSLSVFNGFNRLHDISWDARNEAVDLKGQVEEYKKLYGCYPEIVLADKKYGSRVNRSFLKELGIKYGGSQLGRPSEHQQQKRLPKNIVNQRNHVEGTFGTAKRHCGLNRIMARRPDTSASWIGMIMLTVNLSSFLKLCGINFLSLFIASLKSFIESLMPSQEAAWAA